jgi:hypothetical protein
MDLSARDSFGRDALAKEMAIGVALVLALMLCGVLLYPSSVSQGGTACLLASTSALLAYGTAALLSRRSSSTALKAGLGQGARIGLALAVAEGISISLEDFTAFEAPVRAGLGVAMWGLMFLAFGSAGSAVYYKTGSLPLAVIGSVWSAMVSVVAALLVGFVIGLAFMPRMRQILSEEFVRSGMTDARGFVIQNNLKAASMHLLLAPPIAGFLGFAGGLACSILGSIRRSFAMAWGFCGILMVVGALFAIRFAAGLDRSNRPPFIMGGLLVLGAAMACAHPLFTAIWRPQKKA